MSTKEICCVKYEDVYSDLVECTMDELIQDNSAGAAIEYARRTGIRDDLFRAAKKIDPYHKPLDFLQLLGYFAGCEETFVDEFKAIIEIVFTMSNHIPVEGNEKCFAWVAKILVPYSKGFLKDFFECINVLSTRVIMPRSNVYKKLINYSYKDWEIAYLNYKLYSKYCNKNEMLKLVERLADSYFKFVNIFSDERKRLLREAFETVQGDFIGDNLSFPNNESNWEFARMLVKEGLLSPHCGLVRVHPITNPKSDLGRFKKLDYTEKFASLDYDLMNMNEPIYILRYIKALNCNDYIRNFDRNIPTETLVHLIKLNIFNFDNLPEDLIIRKIGQISNIYEWELFMICDYNSPKLINNIHKVNYKKFLSKEQNIEYINKVINLIYKFKPNEFIKYVVGLLNDDYIMKCYDEEGCNKIIDIADYIIQNILNDINICDFESYISTFEEPNGTSNIEECNALSRKQCEIQIKEKRARINKSFGEINDFEDFINENMQIDYSLYNEETIHILFDEIHNLNNISEGCIVRVLCMLLDKDLVNQEFYNVSVNRL